MTYGVNAPLGLVPYNTVIGAPWSGLITEIPLTASYGTSLFRGDLVRFASGLIVIYTPNGGAAAPPIGVFTGINYVNAQGISTFSPYWPANTSISPGTSAIAIISADPNTVYDIQASGTITTAQINLNAEVVLPAHPNEAGNTATGLSGMTLDTATHPPAATATFPLHILGFTPVPGNVSGVTYNNVLVKLNNTSINAGATGV